MFRYDTCTMQSAELSIHWSAPEDGLCPGYAPRSSCGYGPTTDDDDVLVTGVQKRSMPLPPLARCAAAVLQETNFGRLRTNSASSSHSTRDHIDFVVVRLLLPLQQLQLRRRTAPHARYGVQQLSSGGFFKKTCLMTIRESSCRHLQRGIKNSGTG